MIDAVLPDGDGVALYVFRLRRKVDRDPGQLRTETVIGAGHRFLDNSDRAPSPPAAA